MFLPNSLKKYSVFMQFIFKIHLLQLLKYSPNRYVEKRLLPYQYIRKWLEIAKVVNKSYIYSINFEVCNTKM